MAGKGVWPSIAPPSVECEPAPPLLRRPGTGRAPAGSKIAHQAFQFLAGIVNHTVQLKRILALQGETDLPGGAFAHQLHALLAAQQLLSRSGGGVLSSALAPLQSRIEKLLTEHASGKQWPMERVRVIPHRTRRLDEHAFRAVCSAVLERKRLAFEYRARSTDEKTRRTVSPQRITHYRDNWYLDAWDHEREGLRSFSVDRVAQARCLEEAAIDVDEGELDRHLGGSYGIFSGEPKGVATILFSAKAARWVADEHWHSQQQGRHLADGRYELKVPYSAARELLMDVLHYGSDAEILEPQSLREQARSLLQLALSNYER